jgi:DNA-binding transcriptional LysR family regulator
MVLFVTVVRENGFTRAAHKLGSTKQSVSDRIARLETLLGVRLLERTTRRVRPTELGAIYFERCSRIAAAVEEANQEVRSRQIELTGLLRVTAPFLFGRRFLTPIVATFMRQHPKVRVEIVLGDRRTHLIDDGFDLAIRVGALDDSSLTARHLGNARISTVASPRLLKRLGLTDAALLDGVDCIGIRAEEEWVVQGRRLRIRPKLVVNDLEIACAAALAEIGIAYLPELVTAPHLRSGALIRAFEESSPFRVPVYAVYPSRQFLPAKVRAFIDLLAAAHALDPTHEAPRRRTSKAPTARPETTTRKGARMLRRETATSRRTPRAEL